MDADRTAAEVTTNAAANGDFTPHAAALLTTRHAAGVVKPMDGSQRVDISIAAVIWSSGLTAVYGAIAALMWSSGRCDVPNASHLQVASFNAKVPSVG